VKVTTDLRKGCTESHTGTSASAPLAAGICALVLQVKYVSIMSLSCFVHYRIYSKMKLTGVLEQHGSRHRTAKLLHTHTYTRMYIQHCIPPCSLTGGGGIIIGVLYIIPTP